MNKINIIIVLLLCLTGFSGCLAKNVAVQPNAQAIINSEDDYYYKYDNFEKAKLVKILKDYASSQDDDIQIAALKVLGNIGNEDASVPFIIAGQLKNKNPQVRSQAVLSLRAIGDNGLVVSDEIIKLFQDKDTEVQLSVCSWAQELGPQAKGAMPWLVRFLDYDNWKVRYAATNAITRVGEDCCGASEALVNKLSDTSFRVRLAAGRALGVLPSADFYADKIIALLQSSDEIKRTAIIALGHVKTPKAVPVLMTYINDYYFGFDAKKAVVSTGKKAVPHLIELLNASAPADKIMAANLLAKIGPNAKQAEAGLTENLDNPYPLVKVACARALGKIVSQEESRAISVLADLLKFPNEQVRVASANAFADIGIYARKAAPFLIESLQTDESPKVRRAAALALGSLGVLKPSVYDVLTDSLSDSNSSVRGAGAKALGWLKVSNKKVLNTLGKALLEEGDRNVIWEIANALGDIGGDASDYLIKGLSSPAVYVRKASADALCVTGLDNIKAVKPLAKALKDSSPEVRSSAASSLKCYGRYARIVLPQLHNAYEDEKNPRVKKIINKTIKSIGADRTDPKFF